jgi:molybdenum cofactor synthesis domain-containing protein
MADIRYRAAVVTVSDRGSRGEREDASGPEIARILESVGIEIAARRIIPDEKELIRQTLIELCERDTIDLILTTGGTGVSPRDVTPDATRDVIERDIPGMAEEMRRQSGLITPHAMISRAIVGIRNQTLIINLPGSPRGARENLNVVLAALNHAIEKIQGDTRDCAT